MNPPLFLIVGRTCSGKDTLVRLACEKLGGQQLLSYTTRPRRAEEANTDTHIFTTEEYFQTLNEKDIAAVTQIGPYHYWSTIWQINDPAILYYVIDPIGVRTIDEYQNKYHTIERQVVPIYVYAHSKTRQDRWVARSKDLNMFLERDKAESAQFDAYEAKLGREDNIIISNYVERDFDMLANIVNYHRSKGDNDE